MLKEVALVQGSKEWLDFRKNKIGASDAPIIMNERHFDMTPYKLWQEKLDLIPERYDNPGMQEGRNKEKEARHALERMTGLFFLPKVGVSSSHDWMSASLDAIDPDSKYIAEIKCPSKDDHDIAVAGKVPEKYFPQIQHQLEVCELEMGYYFSFFAQVGVLVKVYRDDAYIKKMIKKEKEFWDSIQELTPPPMTDRDYELREDFEWLNVAQEWADLDRQIKNLKERQDLKRENLIRMANKKSCKGGGVSVCHIVSKGAIDYKSIPELKSIDLENYRKKSIEKYMVLSSK